MSLASTARGNLRFRPLLEFVTVALGFAALAVLFLHPLFDHPSQTVLDPTSEAGGGWLVAPDINLIMWVLSWDWHALTTNPLHLFDANIFHPAPLALASSEHMLGHLPMFAPVYALSGNPVLANQFDILASFAFSGAAMFLLLRHWEAGVPASLLAAFVCAFSPIRVYNIGHSHLLTIQYLPLVFLFLDRTLIRGRILDAAILSMLLTVQMLTSYYIAYMTLCAVAAYGLGVLLSRSFPLRLPGIVLAIAAGLAAGLVIVLLSKPYLHLAALGIVPSHEHFSRMVINSTDFWRNYLFPPMAVRGGRLHLKQGGSAYVGMIPLLLTCTALAVFFKRRGYARWATAGAFASTFTCYVMALGPQLPVGRTTIPLPYAFAMAYVPGFSSMRIPSRFTIVFMVGFAALAGLGAENALRFARRRGMPAVAAVGVLLLLGLGTAYEYGLYRYAPKVKNLAVGAQLPEVYRQLAQLPPGPVLEVPGGGAKVPLWYMYSESLHMLHSAYHWHPLLNGYTGYFPPSYAVTMALGWALPDARATELLARATGLRYVIVHETDLAPLPRTRWRNPPGLDLIGSFGSDLLFGVSNPPPADLVEQLTTFTPQEKTILGTPLAPLPESARTAKLALTAPAPTQAVQSLWTELEVEISNLSSVTWPALVPVGEHAVRIAYRWEDARGRTVVQDTDFQLPYDLEPKQSVRATIWPLAPQTAGAYRLIVGLAQDGRWFPATLAPPLSIEVRASLSANR